MSFIGCRANEVFGILVKTSAPAALVVALFSAFYFSSGINTGDAQELKKAGDKAHKALAAEPTFAPGDRLKISFYERVGSDEDSRTKAPSLSNLVEHTELSGQYAVQLDGSLFIPLLGKVTVGNRTRDGLRKLLAKRVKTAFAGRPRVVIRILRRQPIYVAGRIPRPGRYEYTPGMVVLNAILLAGMPRPGQDSWRHFDIARMKEHLQKSTAKMAELIAKRDALVALRDGVDAVGSKALVGLVGKKDAQKRVTSAIALARLQIDKNKDREKTLNAKLAALKKQRGILLSSLADAAAALKHKTARFKSILRLRQRRIITDNTYFEAQSDVDDSKGRWNDLRATIANLEQRIVDVYGKKSELIADAHIARERRIKELDSLITQAEVTRRTLAPAIGYDLNMSVLKKDLVEFTIIRRTTTGLVRISANRFSPLRPGDIVEVVTESRMRASANSGAPE